MRDLPRTGACTDADRSHAGELATQHDDVHGRAVGHHDPDPGAPLEPELDEGGRERTGALGDIAPTSCAAWR